LVDRRIASDPDPHLSQPARVATLELEASSGLTAEVVRVAVAAGRPRQTRNHHTLKPVWEPWGSAYGYSRSNAVEPLVQDQHHAIGVPRDLEVAERSSVPGHHGVLFLRIRFVHAVDPPSAALTVMIWENAEDRMDRADGQGGPGSIRTFLSKLHPGQADARRQNLGQYAVA
jgi:hypothetical protein